MLAGLVKVFLGGPFNRIFDTVDHALDNETERQGIRANALNRYAETAAMDRADARKYRVFWFAWGLFVFPLGIWWALVLLDTAMTGVFFVDLGISDLPDSIQPKADLIFASIFGSGGVALASQAVASAIRGRR
ncbi:hypothetical protein [Roseibium sp. MMSF_3412]|uniref:hypothetical protein n=1 Tax=Roseibium sp. MMSF_3412 TaxID=3046712 RepID=UPI00273EFB41|nr:hypothetical protein [Roseibium sp. MMSF_3412]